MSTVQNSTVRPVHSDSTSRASRRTDVEFYLRSVARRWKREVAGSDRVILLSPYLTSKTAESVLNATGGESCKVYTVFKAENFAAGASSIDTLIRLQEHGCEIYDLPKLHAKILLVPGSFANIGSQNATRGGTLNREATSAFTDPETVEAILSMVEPWLEDARLVTPDMALDMKLELPPLIRAMRKAQRACAAMDARIDAAEQERVEELARIERERLEAEKRRVEEERIRREAELARAETEKKRLETERLLAEASRIEQEGRERISRSVSEIRERAEESTSGDVDWATAGRFVAASTWWLTHRSGPVRAKGYRHRLTGGDGAWQLPLGANTFHVAHAIKCCRRRLENWLNQHLAGMNPTIAELRESLDCSIRGSVSNFRGDFYSCYGSGYGDMTFGATAVDVDDFIECFLTTMGVKERFSA